ncbi:MAG: hypothetical protein GWN67_04390 [Phycisphaerae bacterium]|nr:hypothetical protein [Phycisphaerae bacterium]NIP56460.1 hypothetical protein [Phycisphaerae bacterium]NIS54915.1 hypothetical protein [Phycisphaerae bacterium]NIU08102.1 hypothetical protein [Phycisphaerae bacterium]NIU55645.1 hypothetical protein [Phycisphaerae bacterium]
MVHFIAEIILAAGSTDEEGTFWITMLMLVVLVAVVGVGSLIKTRAKRFREQKRYRAQGKSSVYNQRVEQIRAVKDNYIEFFLKTAPTKKINKEPMFDFEAAEKVSSGKQQEDRDVSSGMEILDLDFLVKIVENTKGRNKKDVMMRKLVFEELLRREQVGAVNSKALNIYTMNKSKLYSKKIQCGAMKALAERTKPRP